MASGPVNEPLQDELGPRFSGFDSLMPNRVHHVLLVSSLYESFILEEDGLLNELVISEYVDMNLSRPPHITRVSTRQEALRYMQVEPVDLVISMPRVGNRDVREFAAAVKQIRGDLPVVVLATDPRELVQIPNRQARGAIDGVFVWNGDAKILLAIAKLVEDHLNVEHDTRVGGVRVIILIENSVRFYSAYLPLIYTEVVKLTDQVMADGVNVMHRMLRMRARPKIVLAESFEDAWDLYSKYSDYVLGVISDIRFPRNGELDGEAGLEITRRIRKNDPHMPVLLQSSDASHAQRAAELNACFLHKTSRSLLQDLRNFILSSLGFGDFVFTMPDGREVDRAHDLRSFEEAVARIPSESLIFHAQHNHFSNWLMARTEFAMAAFLRPHKVSDFDTPEDVRRHLLRTLREYRERDQAGVVADFSARQFGLGTPFARIGAGSMGGKARGLAFTNALIRRCNLRNRFEGVRIAVPQTAAIGTDVFDAFLDENGLHDVITEDFEDWVLVDAFLEAKMPQNVLRDLTAFLTSIRYPIAVRSSSLLEDSLSRPFAGIYATYMLSNNHPDLGVRLDQLCDAIKLVYASTFFRAAKRYLETTGHRPDEEKMGVVLQEVVGSPHGANFYPTFSGVARSYNFYPAHDMKPEDGVACVVLGLGKMVVEGGDSLMFSPARPEILPQFPTTSDLLEMSQRKFLALDISHPDRYPQIDTDANLRLLGLDVAERDGSLAPIGSVYSAENDRLYDGVDRPGARLVTFAHVLKSGVFPLGPMLQLLLEIGRQGMANPIEIEFAVNMETKPMEFGFLQIRPVISDEEVEHVHLDQVSHDDLVCYSERTLGNGRMRDLRDILYVKPDAFDAGSTMQIASEIGRLNDALRKADRTCILIGPGRWGTADRWLGIPVNWEQISSARVIVETSIRDFAVTPSQGTHFFHNLTSLRVGYLTVSSAGNGGFVDWDWLSTQGAVRETKFVRHVRLPDPAVVRLDGRSRRGAIFKPGRSVDPE